MTLKDPLKGIFAPTNNTRRYTTALTDPLKGILAPHKKTRCFIAALEDPLKGIFRNERCGVLKNKNQDRG